VEILTKSPSVVNLIGGGANEHVAKKGGVNSLKDNRDSMVTRSASAVESKKVVSHTRRGPIGMRGKTKTVGEIVETSVDGEAEWI
jgi:hypothetical protein